MQEHRKCGAWLECFRPRLPVENVVLLQQQLAQTLPSILQVLDATLVLAPFAPLLLALAATLQALALRPFEEPQLILAQLPTRRLVRELPRRHGQGLVPGFALQPQHHLQSIQLLAPLAGQLQQ